MNYWLDKCGGNLDNLDNKITKQEKQTRKLKTLAEAYQIAIECDYCTDEIPEYEGCDPSEIANQMVREINKL